MAEHVLLSDEDLATLARDLNAIDAVIVSTRSGLNLTSQAIADLALEAIRARRTMRKDGRRAEEVRKLRWSIEAVHHKVEKLSELEAGEDGAVEAIARLVDGYEDELIEPAPLAAAIRDRRWR